MKRNRLLRLVVPISLILALVLAMPMLSGCFPKAAEPAAPAAPAPEPAAPEPEPEAPPVEVEPIKVGVPLPMTGWFVADGVAYFQGINMAVSEINAAGGLLGRPLEIVRFDHQNFEPEIVMESADYLCGVVKVDGVHAGWAGYGADVKVYGKYDMPYFMFNESFSSIEVVRSDPELYYNVFQLGDIERPYGVAMADAHLMLPYEYPNNKVALIAGDAPWDREVTAGLGERLEEEGWEIVMQEVAPYGTTEWGALLTEIRVEDPAVIGFEVISIPDVTTFVRQFMEEPTNSLIHLFWSGVLREFEEIMGEEGDGLTMLGIANVGLPVAQNEKAQEYLDRCKLTYGYPPTAGATAVYNGVHIWADAVRAVGDVNDYRAICQWISEWEGEFASGIGTGYFDEDQKLPLTMGAAPQLVQIQGGKFTTIYLWTEPYVDYLGTAYEFQVPPWIE